MYTVIKGSVVIASEETTFICGLFDPCVSPSQRMQLDRVLLHDRKRQTYDQTRKCTETLLLLGQVGP